MNEEQLKKIIEQAFRDGYKYCEDNLPNMEILPESVVQFTSHYYSTDAINNFNKGLNDE